MLLPDHESRQACHTELTDPTAHAHDGSGTAQTERPAEGEAGQDHAATRLHPADCPVTWPSVSGSIRRLYGFELEPEVRDWLDGLGDSDFKRVDEVCGLLAEKGQPSVVPGQITSPMRCGSCAYASIAWRCG